MDNELWVERELRHVIEEVLAAADGANTKNAFTLHTVNALGKTGYIVLGHEEAKDALQQYLGEVIGLTCFDTVWVLLSSEAEKIIADWRDHH